MQPTEEISYTRLRRLADDLETSVIKDQFNETFDLFRLELQNLEERWPIAEVLRMSNSLMNQYTWIDRIEYESTGNSETLASIKQQIQFVIDCLEMA
ncbi:hypothetical protein GCM10028805_05940 [Spirosoma harenae]